MGSMSTVTQLRADITSVVTGEIKAEMARRNYRQSDLALALGITQSQVSKRLRGAIPFDVVELDRIAAWLGVPLAVLVGGLGRPGGGPDSPVPTEPLTFGSEGWEFESLRARHLSAVA